MDMFLEIMSITSLQQEKYESKNWKDAKKTKSLLLKLKQENKQILWFDPLRTANPPFT